MTLDACRKDFSALIDRIEMEKQLELCPELRSEQLSHSVLKLGLTRSVCVQASGSGMGGSQNLSLPKASQL